MPIYEYQCDACGKITEVTQRLSDKPLKECPHCKKKKLRRIISASAFQLKGTGWYVTDFKDKKPGKKDKEKDKDKAKDEKPAEKADTKTETKSSEKETAKSTDAGEKKAAEKKPKPASED